MDLSPRDFLKLLYKYLDEEAEDVASKQCNQLLTNFSDALTHEQINSTYLDQSLHYFFSTSSGLHTFVKKIINKKPFKTSVVKFFEIIYALINNFPFKLKKYVSVIFETCFKVIKSLLVSSDEKVKSLEVVIVILEKEIFLDNSEIYLEVYNNLLKSISITKTDSVEEKTFIALGTFAKHFQYLVPNNESLRIVFLNGLETQMIKLSLSNKQLSGLFTGLDRFCASFPFDMNSKEDVFVVNKVYKYIETLAIPSGTVKIANKAALTFLANNISLFINLMVDKHKYWHDTLLKWLESGTEDQKIGILVLEAFYLGLGTFLLNDGSCHYKHVTEYFKEYFIANMTQSKVFNYDKRLCLQGLSSFSGVYQLQLEQEEIKKLFAQIIQNFEQTYILNLDPSTDVLEFLPFYLQTVANFLQFKTVTNNELFCLQKGTILLMKIFPQLPYYCHPLVTEALVLTFYYLSLNSEHIFNTFLENVIFQGVVWTCSHQHITEAELLETSSQKVVTIKDYLNMWKSLLKIVPVRRFDKFRIFLQERKYILVKVIDKLMRTLLILINKLNVSVTLNDNSEAVTDIQSAYKLNAVNDFAIFLNLVDLYEKIFEYIDSNLLKKCVYKLIHYLIAKCEKHQLISGFYKLLSFCLKICKDINYFNSSCEDATMCYLTLRKFLTSLLNKTQQFTGDLLIACLQVLLQYPIVIIKDMLSTCTPSFRTIFHVGRTSTKLTYLTLETLECWQNEIDPDEFEPFLKQILPLFDSYLQSKSLESMSSGINDNRRKSSQALKKRKVLLDTEPELLRLKTKMIKFVGQQNSLLCEALAVSEDNADLTVWANEQHLKIDLPYEDVKLQVYLDKLLPRIVNVALNSSDRKTRITACELLQATVMIFLGTTKQMSGSGISDLDELLKHVSVSLLRLGCDMDQVVEQLFRPLCFQLIHWYTHPFQSRSGHEAIVIEAILESMTHPTDTALRDFAGKCISEFVKWTIKQSNEKNLSKDPINIKILVKKMRFYSMHPDSNKKLGAALIFNSIYRDIREELSLLSMFWIEILHIFVKSFSSLENDGIDENLVTQINNALSRLERGFVEKSDLFNNLDTQRRIPNEFNGGKLADVAVWLLKQTGVKNDHCRTKCMEIFCSISSKCKGYTNMQNFINSHFDGSWMRDIYETYLIQHPTLQCPMKNEDFTPIKWMQGLLCALDGFIFIIKNKLSSTLSETCTTSIRYFLENVSTITLDEAFAIIEPKMWMFTTFEKLHFDKQRSQAVIKILQLFTICETITAFYTSHLWNLLVNFVFNRQSLGFECFQPQDDDNESVLKGFLNSLPQSQVLQVGNVLSKYVTDNFNDEFDLKDHVKLKQRHIVRGIYILQTLSLKQFTVGRVAPLLNKFLQFAEDKIIFLDDLQDTTLSYCITVLNYSLEDQNEFKVFVDYLYKDYKVQTTNCKQPISFGTYLFTIFEDTIIRKVVTNFDVFFTYCLEYKDKIDKTVEFIFYILRCIGLNKHFKTQHGIVNIVLTNWDIFEEFFNESLSNIQLGYKLLKLFNPTIKSSRLQCDNLKKWLLWVLTYETNVMWREEFELKIETIDLLSDILDNLDENTDLRRSLDCFKAKLISETSPIPAEERPFILDKLLSLIPKIRCFELLVFILEIYAKMSTGNSISDVKHYMTENIMNNQQEHKLLLVKLYDLCLLEDLDNFQKYKLIIDTSSVFQYCNVTSFEDFFTETISTVLTVLKEPVTTENLSNKILHFLLVGVLFLRCPLQSDDSEISRITQAALPQKPNNKTLLLQLLKFTLNAIKDTIDCVVEYEELFRLYKCHSYNAMISIVCNSMKDANFYTKLFVRQEDNKDILWSSLIDTKKTYVFQADFDNIPKQTKILLNIRDEMRLRKRNENKQTQSVRYIETQRVFNSSLAEDVTKFDFTSSILRTQSDDDAESNELFVQSEIELDCTDISTHECMANVCGVIEHMFRAGISEFPDEEEQYELPAWLQAIRTLLLDENTAVNVKIFWVKVIDNTIHIFKHFSKYFTEPLLKFIVDRSAGEVMNYFVADVVAVLATWCTEVTLETQTEIQLASKLVAFLINNLKNDRQDIFKYHLQLIRLLVEAWKTSIEVPYDLIYAKLKVEPTCKAVEIGIHVSSIFLANKLLPWKGDSKDFCKSIFNVILKAKYKTIYRPCAETLGLILRETSHDLPKLCGNVHILLKKINEPDKYAHILEGLVLHYPPIVNEGYLNSLLSRIHGVPKPLKIIYLRILLSRCDDLHKLSDFKTERWETYIENDHLEVQLLALEIVHKSLNVLRFAPTFPEIVQSVCKNVSNTNVLCRTKVFDVVMAICETGILPEVKPVLVQGLCDEDTEIRERVYNFWRNNSSVPHPVADRFLYLLKNFYEESTENDFLGNCCYFLLERLKFADDYSKLLFEHPLEDCNFEDYYLETNWRARYLSVVPLFAETVRSFSMSLQTFDSKLRQTQTSLEFAPTQVVRSKQFSQYTMSESSLFIKPEEEKSFVDPNSINLSYKYRIPKRRFLKDKAKVHSYFAQQQVKKSSEKIEKRKEFAKERENKVTIYRSYRKGDLPDVQITLQAVLEPLQILALRDREISKILYEKFLKSILEKRKSDANFIQEISVGIQTIFNNSSEFSRNLFRALFDALIFSKSSIVFPPELIVSVSQSSGLRGLGALLLEEYLISCDVTEVEAKKSRGNQLSQDTNLWIKLAELYKEMEEWDVVKSIFLEKTQCPQEVKNALLAESQKQWKDARDLYQSLIETDDVIERKDFYYDSYFKCFAHLGAWNDLINSVDSIVSQNPTETWNNLWDQGFNQEKLLPWYISGHLKDILFTDSSTQHFLSSLNSSLESSHLAHLETHYLEEITMLWIFKNDIQEAEHYLKIYINNFLEDWQQLDSFYANLRYMKLLKLRNMIDIDKFLDVLNNISIENVVEIDGLVKYWNRAAFENLPSILLKEDRVLYRKQFLRTLVRKIESFDNDDFANTLTQLNDMSLKLDEDILEAAIGENNFYMTKKYLNLSNNRNAFKTQLILSKLAYIKSLMLNNSEQKLNVILQGIKTLVPIFEETESFLQLSAHVTFFKHLDYISSLLSQNEDLLQNRQSDLMTLTEVTQSVSSKDVAFFAANKLKSFLHNYNTSDVCTDAYIQYADAYVQLAYFAKNQGKKYFKDFMLFVLRAMKFNSKEGKQLFPCVLMEQEFSLEEQQLFLTETEQIPVWMFLKWIPQILVNIDSSKVTVIKPLVLKIATTYPQAIMYAYRLSKENYKCEQREAKELIETLDELLLTDEGANKFLKALSFIGIPAAILIYYVRKIVKLIASSELGQAKIVHDFVLKEMFIKADSRDSDLLQGNMFKSITKYEKDLKNIGRLLTKPSETPNVLKQLQKINTNLGNTLQDRRENQRNSRLLKEYCPWLANFSASKNNLELEIPGQYDGERIPLVQHHVKISGFCPNVSIMSSLRKPIKITILGNDTKEYPFLVKFGEDVRQDQRIQQLFSLMNNIFQHDRNLNGRKFHILTYQVIPLTTSLGIIQWIGNTKSLHEFSNNENFDKVVETFTKWIYTSANQSPFDAYGRAAMKYSRDKTIVKFKTLVSKISWDVFRSTFLKLSSNTEGFFALRNNFIKSYAIMCASHWIVGVGDRHLSNSLVCLNSGKVLGIDFGHAFGTATQILPVPELVPFRLTPHIVNLMEPLGATGLFREIMVHCLRSLRSNSASLLSTMNVFIKEPSLDWLEHASRFSTGVDTSNCDWYPAQKIEQARKKLAGANSVNIMIEDLLAGHQKNQAYMKAYIALVEGNSDFNVRARLAGNGLSEEDQAICLIDHATDYNLLGRMFEGWAAWV
ncbi:DNA-dependent protein kinase catalytic subunit [Tribolium castaneum]|uniref:DNA-dependent protein kinase catalytic subunit n=1 Tax=Tribolium castaneum TaxID=7070 RepID=UPI0030FECD1F